MAENFKVYLLEFINKNDEIKRNLSQLNESCIKLHGNTKTKKAVGAGGTVAGAGLMACGLLFPPLLIVGGLTLAAGTCNNIVADYQDSKKSKEILLKVQMINDEKVERWDNLKNYFDKIKVYVKTLMQNGITEDISKLTIFIGKSLSPLEDFCYHVSIS